MWMGEGAKNLATVLFSPDGAAYKRRVFGDGIEDFCDGWDLKSVPVCK